MRRYQDCVIKDGKFIGKFEEMYKKFEDPWLQTSFNSSINSYSRNVAILNMRRYKIKSLLECGCGLGYYTGMIAKNVKGIKIKGIDLSPTAIKKAKALHPNLDFAIDNVDNIEHYSNYKNILFAEITWYILSDLDRVFQKIFSHFRRGYFLHNLVFYKNGVQKYGRNYFTTLKQFIEYVPFKLIGYSEATTIDSDTIETSAIFKIIPK